MTFTEKLDKLIKRNGLTRGSFAKGAGIPYTTVVGFYEKGCDNIKLSNLKKIAEFFDVSIEYLCDESDLAEIKALTDELAKKYSALTVKGRSIVNGVIDGLLDMKETSTETKSPAAVEYIREYLTPAAAGYVSPALDEDYILIPRDEDTPKKADFAVRIDGDSMEPYIAHGSRVFVSRTNEVAAGDVGIFFVDGDMKCKQFFEDNFGNIYLISANRKRSDADVTVSADSSVEVFCFGKVLLKNKLPMPKI